MSEEEKTREQKTQTHFVCEYKDEKGNIICVAKFELSPDTTEITLPDYPDNKTHNLHQLRSLVLEAVDPQGRPIRTDVLSIANPHNLDILVWDNAGGHYQHSTKKIVIPLPSTQMDLATFLHELGHGDQYTDKNMKKITDIKMTEGLTEVITGCFQPEDLPKKLRQVVEAIPKAQKMLERVPPTEMEELMTLIKKAVELHDEGNRYSDSWIKAFKEQKLINAKIILEQASKEASDEQMGELMAQSIELEEQIEQEQKEDFRLQKEIRKLELQIDRIITKNKIKEILNLPRMKMEGDASRRAVLWMRQIKNTGIDIMASQKLSGEHLENLLRDRCGGTKWVGDPKESLSRALITYSSRRRRG